MAEQGNEVLTIGHSSHSYEQFLKLLRNSGITAVADVRSVPFSRTFPQFNRDNLHAELRADNVAYSFLGAELGGRPKDPQFFCDGVADYEAMARATTFEKGLDRVFDGASRYRIALMCSEHDPLDCHRCLLVGRALAKREMVIRHVLGDGSERSQAEIEGHLLAMAKQGSSDLFASREDQLAAAYRSRSRRVAFSARRPIPIISAAAE